MAEQSQGRGNLTVPSPFVQVCDRCRWKKIKCDGQRPCGNCRRANLPCETRARLSKHSTPRSYVQYLEERIRQLEGQRDSAWSPQASDSRNSPYGKARLQSIDSSSQSPGGHPKKRSLPDWTVLKELGTHVIDEDGFTRYMGPSSGVGFAARILQEIMDDDQPADQDYYSLFSIDDFSRARALAATDQLLWEVVPTNLPPREAVDKVFDDFFKFTERIFPILHRPTFVQVVDELYSLESIGIDYYEVLAQFYLTLSIGHCFNFQVTFEQRTQNQIRGLQTGVRCFYTALHTRRDGLSRLQTFALHSYALVLLRQRSEAMRVSAMANTKALECGLHHDGAAFAGNPLETEMRRRVFWCVFMLHLFNSSVEGLPRALHEVDITVLEPTDVDDEQLTTTEIRQSIPGRSKIHRFVSVCRLSRILSRVLDVLYSHNKRKHASTRIEQMNRLCCEHLLDQLDFSFEETPDDIPDPDTEDPAELAILASYAHEQILYYYIRWLIHRPGVTLSRTDPQFALSLQIATEAAAGLLRVMSTYKRACAFLNANPAVPPCTIFIAALTPLYRTTLLRSQSGTLSAIGYSAEADFTACQEAAAILAEKSHCHSDVVRRRVLQDLVRRVFSQDGLERTSSPSLLQNPFPPHHATAAAASSRSHVPSATAFAVSRQSTIRSNYEKEEELSPDDAAGEAGEQQQQGQQESSAGAHAGPSSAFGSMDYQEQQIEHYTAHEDLRNLVHEAFSPGLSGPWASGGSGGEGGGGSGGGGGGPDYYYQ
ncbi:fungal-specific transcription factor domain-containing protein [Neohortaea acidophila]|uniref:Fungal-specific transcription factor domain-containing protein n=1 Tax=Neohortaea acidophila TaxID=245834 RepID=A0A6A6PWN4_9PEZI|nr:fungal-specific transcription factor domain-containing protein [Neohortaea acidophila]KAF2484144.1 fungal-specific transcription factor domain-containing protein [Neohortaea acidophila]